MARKGDFGQGVGIDRARRLHGHRDMIGAPPRQMGKAQAAVTALTRAGSDSAIAEHEGETRRAVHRIWNNDPPRFPEGEQVAAGINHTVRHSELSQGGHGDVDGMALRYAAKVDTSDPIEPSELPFHHQRFEICRRIERALSVMKGDVAPRDRIVPRSDRVEGTVALPRPEKGPVKDGSRVLGQAHRGSTR